MRMKRVVADLQKKADSEALARPVSADAPVASPAEALKRNRLNEMKAEMEKIDKQIGLKLENEQRVRDAMSTYQKRIEAAPTRESELTELTRDYRTLQTTYTSMLSKREDSKVAANLERRQIGEQFKILDPARLPERPTSPNRPQLQAIGVSAGLAIGLVLAALMEYLDKTLRSEADVTAALNLLVLATIPVLPEVNAREKRRWKVVAVSAAALLVAVAGAAAIAWKVWK
jgi:uncharacterized protein involved in exopolysaccharide biosynthesis